MKKILFIGNFLSKSRGTIGPSEQISKSLREHGYFVHTASHYENIFLRLTDIIIKCLVQPYEIIHIDVFSGKSFFIAKIASMIGKLRSKKIILNLHGGMLPEYYRKYPKRVINLLLSANRILSPSSLLSNFFFDKGIQVEYLPNPIHLVRFPMRNEEPRPKGILWVRGFQRIYNPEIAILCLEKLLPQYPDALLTMIGPDMGLREDCEELIDKKGLNKHVKIEGSIENTQLSDYFHINEVFINTTSYESFGVAVLEAAACGIPIVSSNVGEIPYLWTHEHDILLAEKLDAAAFAQQISRIFDDKELARKLSVNARQKAEQYDWKVILPRWIELLERA